MERELLGRREGIWCLDPSEAAERYNKKVEGMHQDCLGRISWPQVLQKTGVPWHKNLGSREGQLLGFGRDQSPVMLDERHRVECRSRGKLLEINRAGIGGIIRVKGSGSLVGHRGRIVPVQNHRFLGEGHRNSIEIVDKKQFFFEKAKKKWEYSV